MVAGVLVGAIGGFVAALFRPRSVHRQPAKLSGFDMPPLPERDATTDVETVQVRR